MSVGQNSIFCKMHLGQVLYCTVSKLASPWVKQLKIMALKTKNLNLNEDIKLNILQL